MGRGVSKSGGGGGGGNSTNTRNSGGGSPQRTVLNNSTFNDWIGRQDPERFVNNEPDNINIGGVSMTRYSSTERLTAKGDKQYVRSYQSDRQASNGEYPIVDVVVTRKKKRGAWTLEFDKSTTGSGIK